MTSLCFLLPQNLPFSCHLKEVNKTLYYTIVIQEQITTTGVLKGAFIQVAKAIDRSKARGDTPVEQRRQNFGANLSNFQRSRIPTNRGT